MKQIRHPHKIRNKALRKMATNKNTSDERNTKTLALVLVSNAIKLKISNLFSPYSTCYRKKFIHIKLLIF